LLYFGAANYFCRVWVNGKKLGEHVGGFTPFDFDATDQLTDGENSVVVEVDNTRHADGVPALKTDFWNYGGLTRGAKLVEVSSNFIQDYSIQLAKGKTDLIEGWVQLAGAAGSGQVTIEIPDIHIKQSAQVDASGRAIFRFPIHVELWSPEHPKLYQVVISGGDDRVTDEIGFRTIETRGAQILLNGKPIFLRGISMHEEAPFRSGKAFSEEDDRTLLNWAKELGCNFIRMALANDAHCTVIPSRLPPEATLYLPVSVSFDPSADTLLYLIDDPKRVDQVDLQSFKRRLPDLNIESVTPVTIPYGGGTYRYRLFRLTLGIGSPKTFADARSTIGSE
jgi:hypothetical protein